MEEKQTTQSQIYNKENKINLSKNEIEFDCELISTCKSKNNISFISKTQMISMENKLILPPFNKNKFEIMNYSKLQKNKEKIYILVFLMKNITKRIVKSKTVLSGVSNYLCKLNDYSDPEIKENEVQIEEAKENTSNFRKLYKISHWVERNDKNNGLIVVLNNYIVADVEIDKENSEVRVLNYFKLCKNQENVSFMDQNNKMVQSIMYLCTEGYRTYLLISFLESHVEIWELNSGEMVKAFKDCCKVTNLVQLSGVVSQSIVMSHEDGSLSRWILSDNKDELVINNDIQGKSRVTCLMQLNYTKLRVLYSTKSVIIYSWNLQDELPEKEFRGHSSHILSLINLDFLKKRSPGNSTYFASGSIDTYIKIWNYEAGTCIKTLQGHDLGVRWMTFLKKGNEENDKEDLLVSGDVEGKICFWELKYIIF